MHCTAPSCTPVSVWVGRREEVGGRGERRWEGGERGGGRKGRGGGRKGRGGGREGRGSRNKNEREQGFHAFQVVTFTASNITLHKHVRRTHHICTECNTSNSVPGNCLLVNCRVWERFHTPAKSSVLNTSTVPLQSTDIHQYMTGPFCYVVLLRLRSGWGGLSAHIMVWYAVATFSDLI